MDFTCYVLYSVLDGNSYCEGFNRSLFDLKNLYKKIHKFPNREYVIVKKDLNTFANLKIIKL